MTDTKDDQGDQLAGEHYARLPSGKGYAYAVLVEGCPVPQRFHDARMIGAVTEQLVGADGSRVGWIVFGGAPDGDPAAPATGAGPVRTAKVLALRYWGPHDDAPRDAAADAAAALMGALFGAVRDQLDAAAAGAEPEPEASPAEAPAPPPRVLGKLKV